MGAGLGFAQEGFYFTPHHFDGVEVGRVSGQETDLGPGLSDECQGTVVFVGAKVVQDDDIPRSERGDQHFAHVGLEDLSVGRSLDRHAGAGPVQAHRGDHRGGPPVAVRRAADQSLALGGATPQPRQIGLGGRLVDEDQPRRVEPALAPPPAASGPRHVRPVLFRRMERLFLYVSPSLAKT